MPPERPPTSLFSLPGGPKGTRCPSVRHFHSQNYNDPKARWDSVCTLGFDLVFSNFVSEELPGHVCSRAVLLQLPTGQATALVFSVRFISGHKILCSPKVFSFFPVDTCYSYAKICSIMSHFLLIRQLCWETTVIFKALPKLLMCIYPAEQTCLELLAILSASDIVPFVSFNETGRNNSLLTVCWGKGGQGEPMRVDSMCLSAGFQTCCSFVLAWFCSKTLSTG